MQPFEPTIARPPIAVAFVLGAAILAACGAERGTVPPPLATPAAAPTPAAPPAICPAAIPTVDRPHDGAWATWTHEQRAAYMKEAVLPTEAPLFREYSGTRFAELTCRSCHGASADDGSYKMPNPALPKLAKEHLFEMEKTRPTVFRFMYDVVTPRTAALLNVPEWSHKTMSGFGCFNCHTQPVEESKPPEAR